MKKNLPPPLIEGGGAIDALCEDIIFLKTRAVSILTVDYNKKEM